MNRYHHTQRAAWLWWVLAAFVALELLIALALNLLIGWIILGAVSVFLLVVAWLFSSLTVTVDDEAVAWHFGPGFWRRRILRSEITGAEPTRTHWTDGWGIRITSRGTLYNVGGLDAVAITRSNGKTTLIGTDDPQDLATVLRPPVTPAG